MKFDSIYESSNAERLGNSIKFVKGKQPSISKGGTSKVYLTIEALTSGDSGVVSSEGVLCKENDVLMVMDGASSGRCFIGNDGYVGSTLARIDTNGINHTILFFALKKHEKEIAEHTTGSAIPHADKSFVSELFYPIVDTETASSFERLISLVVSKRKENLRLKALKTALLAKFY